MLRPSAEPPRLAPPRGPRCACACLVALFALGVLALCAAIASLREPCPGAGASAAAAPGAPLVDHLGGVALAEAPPR